MPGPALLMAAGEGIAIGRPPRLFRAYLDISAKVCGPPAIDREFKTIGFLTLIDLTHMPDRVRVRFFFVERKNGLTEKRKPKTHLRDCEDGAP